MVEGGETLQIRRRLATSAGNTLFGEYTLLHVLAQGRVGVIVEAEHNSLKRAVALKLVNPTHAEKTGFSFSLIEGFLREARIMASIDHQNVVPIYHGGTVGHSPYIAMRLVRGGDLSQRVARHGPMSPDQTLRLMLDLASGLQAVHAAGYIHGDVKPANLLLEDQGIVRLADFGRAVPIGTVGQPATEDGPAYIAPELPRGAKWDERTDVFALAAAGWFALTGLPPPPPQVIPERARTLPGPGDGLATIFVKGMAPDPDARYPGPGELLEDCLAVLDGGRAQHATGRLRRKLMFFGWGDRKAGLTAGPTAAPAANLPGAPAPGDAIPAMPASAASALSPKSGAGIPGFPPPPVLPPRPAPAPAPQPAADDDPFPE
jgi:serine/threonine-protein kinase